MSGVRAEMLLWERRGIALIQHLFKLGLGVAFEPDKFNPKPMIPLPANRGNGYVDGTPCAGQLNMHTEVGSDWGGQI
jgi:hypothetical protein